MRRPIGRQPLLSTCNFLSNSIYITKNTYNIFQQSLP